MLDERGFTLTELLIVVAIIAILAAIGLPYMTTQIRASIEARTKANLNTVRTAITNYYAGEGHFPTDHLGDLIDKGYLSGPELPMLWEYPYHAEGNGVCVGPPTIDTLNSCVGAAYAYDNDSNSSTWGTLIDTCIHTDLRGVVWSSY